MAGRIYKTARRLPRCFSMTVIEAENFQRLVAIQLTTQMVALRCTVVLHGQQRYYHIILLLLHLIYNLWNGLEQVRNQANICHLEYRSFGILNNATSAGNRFYNTHIHRPC